MAVPHFSVSIVTRGKGASAVLSAAYRHCAKMEYEREARTVDYTRKRGLLHEEIAIPADAPLWLRQMIANGSMSVTSEAFWNRVEHFEKRSDAQLAKDVTIALPNELSARQNIELVKDFVARHITNEGMVADWVFHDAPGNPHIHLMTTLRPLTEDGFGSKKVAVVGPDGVPVRNEAGKIIYQLWAGGSEEFNALRDGWFACQARHLALAGLDVRIDGRSFEKQGIGLVPTIHLGVGARAIQRKMDDRAEVAALERLTLQEGRRAENARRIERDPGLVLALITREKSVFDERDVARIVHRYIDDASIFQSLIARILQSPQTLRLDRERIDLVTGARMPAKYTTRELVRLEAEMANRAIWLSQRARHGVRRKVLDATFAKYERLSAEQKTAIEHVAGKAGIAAVVGRAGAGKTTMMKAACEAWEAVGYRVVGGALAGKAAEGLEKEAGIPSRTLAAWELSWRQDRNAFDDRTVFVLDEAGMVSSRQMALLVERMTRTGAKLVLVGDPEQLQPIEAGAAFRAIADRIGYAGLETIYRQREQWMRDATLDLARGNVGRALDAYRTNGRLVGAEMKGDAVSKLVSDWIREYDPAKSILILAHLRRDVHMLNELVRARLIEKGVIECGSAFSTSNGSRRFAAGDQIVFLKNDGSLCVKNGMLGKVIEAASGRIVAEIDDGEARRHVSVEQRFYNTIDHGYATTVHKAQGTTVDRVKVLASLSLDRHLTYVAMTRHREDLCVYYGRRSFTRAGGLSQILSRRNAKQTSLDYAGGSIYAQALRFAEARGLHLANVARTIARDRLEWTVRQKHKLAELTRRLTALGARIGLGPAKRIIPDQAARQAAMVAGITTFSKSIGQVVEDRIAADLSLKKQWEEVSMRFHHVYAQPDSAFRAIDVDAMLQDQAASARTIMKIASDPGSFGALNGKTGIFTSHTDRLDREQAIKNVRPLADSIGDYLRQRREAERINHAMEAAVRRQVALEIPCLSLHARNVLEQMRQAFDRDELPSGLQSELADKVVSTEIETFAQAVSERFGERTFLPDIAKEAKGETFQRVTAGMNATQKSQVERAWSVMRTAQQLSAHQRSTIAMKHTGVLRPTSSKKVTLK
ncbi:Ti-type conjugative transfer relaxase TraA [Agrobacterium sp. V1]|uniref:Ti-type conjugative transfer relaxase TraA n=1 Tax=Agrobacterium sp. V1 TaxID=3061957 RepID=UPI00267412CE|nr:Ti-type conjugative transfer relaxase TraA [Agrobacterium sp. V1]MDO3445448.1 Ti-type conjugative transfer relaxase TraA [Agrobacterium sp. V1]